MWCGHCIAHSKNIIFCHPQLIQTGRLQYEIYWASFAVLWQEIVIARKINLLIVDEGADSRIDYYSTCDYGFTRFPDVVIEEKWVRLQKDVFKGNTNSKVGRKNAVATSRFQEEYWYYQNFYIKVDEAYTNLGINKQIFYNLSKEYEESEGYLIPS